MKQFFTIAFIMVMGMIFSLNIAYAEGNRNCVPRETVLERLADMFGDIRRVF